MTPAQRSRSRQVAGNIEALEERTLLAVVLPGGVSSVTSTLAHLLPAPILTSVNNTLAGGNSSALLYTAFDGETNHVRISGSYLNLFLLADDDPQDVGRGCHRRQSDHRDNAGPARERDHRNRHNATPISGDFNPAHVGDEIGLFDGKKWYFDTNGNNNIDAGDRSFTGNLTGTPITGDGKVDLAVHSAQLDQFSFDLTSAEPQPTNSPVATATTSCPATTASTRCRETPETTPCSASPEKIPSSLRPSANSKRKTSSTTPSSSTASTRCSRQFRNASSQTYPLRRWLE